MCCVQLCIKPAGLARRIKLPVDIVIGTLPLKDPQHKVTCHPLLAPDGDDSSTFPFPFFTDSTSEQVSSSLVAGAVRHCWRLE